jgi:glucose/arabinose dehydrogenase
MSTQRFAWRLWAVSGLVAIAMSGCKHGTDSRDSNRRPTAGEPAGQTAEPADVAGATGDSPGPQPAPTAAAPEPASAPAPDLGPVSTKLGDPPAELSRKLTLLRVARGLARPVALEFAPGDASGRLFVVEQHKGRVRILRRGAGAEMKIDGTPFFDLQGKVSRGNEQGLLGLVFHPDFARNRRLYVNYTDPKGTTHVVEYKVDASNPDRVDMATARQIFRLEQPYSNHNAGDLEFGPEGKLYVGMGDGGAAGDPLNAGQDAKNLLGKMLRFDVDAREPKPEIVQMGLRNPWRYAFDARTGDLYIGDVGQNRWEFVYVVPADAIEGHNFGWNVVEGNHCYKRKDCDPSPFTPAVVDYDHSQGCSITGGEVYRGKAIPELDGVYFYADYCTSLIRSFRWTREGVHQHWDWRKALDPGAKVSQISSFGHDAEGELYVVSLTGEIYKLVRK